MIAFMNESTSLSAPENGAFFDTAYSIYAISLPIWIKFMRVTAGTQKNPRCFIGSGENGLD